jgi:hypothetical protein
MNAELYYNLVLDDPEAAAIMLDAWLEQIKADIIASLTEEPHLPILH